MPRTSPAQSPLTPPDGELVRGQLARILASAPFRGSKRSSDFLKYVVEQTLDGHFDLLKERSLGIAVFERAPDYDTNQDPIVRNTAGQVRRRLAQYYQEVAEAGADPVRIELPSGSYVPEFHIAAAPLPEPPPVVPVPVPELVPPPDHPVSGRGLPWRLLMVAGVIFGLAFLGLLIRPRPDGTDLLRRFWSPLLSQPGPVVVCVGQGHTYKLSPELDRRFEEAAAAGLPPAGQIRLSEIMPAWDRYFGVTDVMPLVRLTATFARFGKDVDLAAGRLTQLETLRRKPVVLLGAFNNDWTLKLTGELRFYFEQDSNGIMAVVRDRQNPGQVAWSANLTQPINQLSTDYAIVTRVHNPTTEQSVFVAAGLRGGGTAAAGEFITNPEYLKMALAKAPPDWSRKNLQFVISAKLFSGSPGPPTVLATHYW